MGRGKDWVLRRGCAADGCDKVSWLEATTRREYDEARVANDRRPWRCVRHAAAEEVLSVENPQRTGVLEVAPSRFLGSTGLYWQPPGEYPGSGSVFGVGYRAFAADFPLGTRLVVTAHIELPEAHRGQG